MKTTAILIMGFMLIMVLLGMEPWRAVIGTILGAGGMACFLSAGATWLTACCPTNRYVPPVLMSVLLGTLSVMTFFF